jgi:phosphate transport system substrate-binding protein
VTTHRSRRLLLLLLALMPLAVVTATPAGATASHTLITGSGSSWSSNAVDQWIADVKTNGLQIVYSAVGSAQGRKDFAYKTTDFAVSDIGYLGVDPVTGEQDTSNGRAYAYLPIVAGGTAFPYQILVGGKKVTNLRLSGLTLAKIFTNQIKRWNDPAITADNNGRVLPSLPIIPVVHSEGSGSSAQFTRYLDTRYPTVWRPFLGASGSTEYFPRKGDAIAQNGSDGVMNFVASAAANGAIGYDEYSYALGKNFPVAKLENSAKYFTLPTQYNVAVALTKAQINMDKSSPNYLLQNLDRVYDNPDLRAYPMSSYSYMIIPTASDDARMTTAKRQTLADFLYYSICQGQASIGPTGYSPLPINLVQASFDQTAKLKTADPNVDLTRRNVSTCHNPTFVAGQPTRNYLAEIAPKPPACDQAGQGPCSSNQNTTNGNPTGGKPPSTPSNGGGGSSTTGGGNQGGTGNQPGATPAASGAVDPTTGQVTSGGDTASNIDLVGTPTDLSAGGGGNTELLATLAAAEILLILVLPPVVAARLRRRRRSP